MDPITVLGGVMCKKNDPPKSNIDTLQHDGFSVDVSPASRLWLFLGY